MGANHHSTLPTPRHLLILTPSYPTADAPASGIFFRDQALALQRAELRIGVLAPRKPCPELVRQGKTGWPSGILRDASDGIEVFLSHLWSAHWQLDAAAAARAWSRWGLQIFELYRREVGAPDLVHAHGALGAGTLAARIRAEHRIPYVLTEHSSRYSQQLRSSELQTVSEAFREAAARLVVSPSLGQDLEKHVGPAVRPWIHVPNLVSPDFRPFRQPGSETPFRYLNIALMHPRKGQSELLEAFSRAFQRDDEVELTLIGDGPCRQLLQSQAELLGINDRIHFRGICDRRTVVAEIQDCHALVQSSHYETFGVVLIEALACGKPVIATRCGGPESIVEAGDGVLVEPGNIDQLAEALARLRKTHRDYEPSDLLARCLARFGERTVVKKLMDVYRQVLQVPASGDSGRP